MNIPFGLRRARQIYGDHVAIHHNQKKITYRQFYDRVMQSARALERIGVKKGDRVAVLLLNSPEFLELYYATAFLGAVIVPMNIRLGLDEMAFWLNDSEAGVLAVDDRFAPIAEQLKPKLQSPPVTVFAGQGECPSPMLPYHPLVESESAEPLSTPEPEPKDLAGLFYTSGTTGGPKGVMLTHRNLFANAMNSICSWEVHTNWVWLHCAPMFHLANGAAMYSLTMLGATHTFVPGFEPDTFCRAVERYGVTATILVPTMINMLMNSHAIDKYDLSTLTALAYGASPMPLDLLKRCVDRFGFIFRQGYGLSEAAPLLTTLTACDHVFERLDEKFTPVKSAGRPVPGCDVRVVDINDRELPPRQIGEVVARGDNIMAGYWKRPEITAQTLRNGWLHTGDLGAFDERGYLYILDRAKDMIKTGGENVYSPEVEAVIYEHHSVLEAAVIGVPDEHWGEAIKAFVVLRPGSTLTADDLLEFCRDHLTHFKCPKSVEFIDALPKGGTGKVQKSKLRELYCSPRLKGVS